MFLLNLILGVALLFFVPAQSMAADAELKPGDTVGPHNWELVRGMVGENLLHRIKQGYTFKIKQGRSIGPPRSTYSRRSVIQTR